MTELILGRQCLRGISGIGSISSGRYLGNQNFAEQKETS
jgi:hypothetical protein